MNKSDSYRKPSDRTTFLFSGIDEMHKKLTEALTSGMINDKEATDKQIDQMKRIDEYCQKAIDTGKMLIGVFQDFDWNERYHFLVSGYALVLQNIWQRIDEIDKGIPESEYTTFTAELLLHYANPRTAAEGLPYWKHDLDEWLADSKKAKKIEQYRYEIEQIPVLLEWRKNHSEAMVQPLFTAIDYYVATLHRDCATAIGNV